MDNICEMLQNCDERAAAHLERRHFHPGEFILHQGDKPASVFLLLKGQAKNYLMTPNGISYLAYFWGENELIGDFEIFSDRPIICNIQAFTECDVLRIPRENFYELIYNNHEFLMQFLRQLTDKFCSSSLMTATNIAYPLGYRVDFMLWSMTTAGNKYISKDDVIQCLGAKVRSVNRIIRSLIDRGIVEYDHKVIKVLSLERLSEDMRRFEPSGENGDSHK